MATTRQAVPAAKPQAKQTLRWVLAHEPVALFEPAARQFAGLVEEGTKGELRVDVLSMSDYAPGKKLAMADVNAELSSGRLMMAQTPCVNLGFWQAPFWGLEAPFIFKGHDHATRVLDGKIGQSLLDSLRPKGLRGLCFTYSGGERIISTASKELRRVDDLQGLRMRICHTPVAEATMKALGATTIQAPVSQISELTKAGKIDGAESTWARYWDQRHDKTQPIVHETSHSYLLTAVVLQEKVFQSLSAAHQEIVVSAARKIAVSERQYSLEQGAKAKAQAMAAGVKVVAWDSGEGSKFEARAKQAQAEIRKIVGGDLLDAIAKA